MKDEYTAMISGMAERMIRRLWIIVLAMSASMAGMVFYAVSRRK